MTELAMADTVLAPISDLSDTLVIGQYAETENVADATSVRTYAGGVRRVISTPGTDKAYNLSYRQMSRESFDSLLDLVSVPILFRDQRSRLVYGVISSVYGAEAESSDRIKDVSFTVQNITYSEIV